MLTLKGWSGVLGGVVTAAALLAAPAYAGDGAKAEGACATCMCGTAGADAMTEAAVGKPAPAFTLADAEGKDVSLADFKGKTVVLHFQSCECPWDVAYQPMLNALATQYADKGVVFLGINSNKAEDYARIGEYVPSADVPYTIVKDPGNNVADAYKAQTTPHMYVIDGEGVLRYMGGIEAVPTMATVGKMDEQYLAPVLDALLAGEELPYTETTSKGCSIKRAN